MSPCFGRKVMIITVGGIKGGVGKSMIAINLVVMRSKNDKKVLLVDADEQGTSGDWVDHRIGLGVNTPWTTIRLKGSAVRSEIKKLENNYNDIIIDCGGRDTTSLRAALTVSDIFLIPFQPKSFDIWTSSKVSTLIEEAKTINEKLIAFSFINCASPRGNDNDDAKNIIAKSENLSLLPATIGLRKAFSNATSDGLAVTETKQESKAISEMLMLHDSIFCDTNMTPTRHKTTVKTTSL
jgi:chromosome partitioning protein